MRKLVLCQRTLITKLFLTLWTDWPNWFGAYFFLSTSASFWLISLLLELVLVLLLWLLLKTIHFINLCESMFMFVLITFCRLQAQFVCVCVCARVCESVLFAFWLEMQQVVVVFVVIFRFCVDFVSANRAICCDVLLSSCFSLCDCSKL